MKKLYGLLVASVLLLSAPASYAGSQDFTLVNSAPYPICHLYVHPAVSEIWGDDLLPSCLVPGQSFYVDMPDSGVEQVRFDVRVEDEDRNGEEYYGFDLDALSKITILGGAQITFF